jgi:hypothetical protein
MTLETIFWIAADMALLLGGSLRLVRLAIMDDLGRRALLPLEERLRDRLPEERQWIADGFTCPFCIGFWIGAVLLGTYWFAGYVSPEWMMVPWRLIMGSLALNYVVGHLVATLDIYDGDEEEELVVIDNDEEPR